MADIWPGKERSILLNSMYRYSDITMIDSEDYLQYFTGYLYFSGLDSSSLSRPIKKIFEES